ncbi:protein phosphatase 1, regulatory subunit 8a isoform X4 [Clupea harengus]|uniref:Putative nuclease HARBI1 n=1 Tax=Clupea harengus TaxID=7950 RepID=A0A6P8H1J6_CLUHA|nr:protein phosphatase 1, regulatory subunit 8a isoform X4 [Clupea harengus]
MAHLLLLEYIAYRSLRNERLYRDHVDLFAESDDYLIERFRLPRPVLLELCNTLEPALRTRTKRSNPVPPHVQVLSALGFLATGTFQRELGDRVGISQSTISRGLQQVVDGIVQLVPQYIRFPYTDQEQIPVKRAFHAIAGLPNTIGAIDCTHVRIKGPSPDPFPYLNRRQYHSINVQIICDAQNHLLNVVSRFPGGALDSYILQNSSVGVHLEQGDAGDAWLIGDHEYALAPWLMTPLTNPETEQEVAYNERHARAHSTAKHSIRLLKKRWMCLDETGGGKLLYKPEKVCRMIMACCVLHNMAMKSGVPLDLQPPYQPPHYNVGPEPFRHPENSHAVQVRQQLIRRM